MHFLFLRGPWLSAEAGQWLEPSRSLRPTGQEAAWVSPSVFFFLVVSWPFFVQLLLSGNMSSIEREGTSSFLCVSYRSPSLGLLSSPSCALLIVAARSPLLRAALFRSLTVRRRMWVRLLCSAIIGQVRFSDGQRKWPHFSCQRLSASSNVPNRTRETISTLQLALNLFETPPHRVKSSCPLRFSSNKRDIFVDYTFYRFASHEMSTLSVWIS